MLKMYDIFLLRTSAITTELTELFVAMATELLSGKYIIFRTGSTRVWSNFV
jgi:hypothetical protein